MIDDYPIFKRPIIDVPQIPIQRMFQGIKILWVAAYVQLSIPSAYMWKQHMVISMPKSLMNKQNKSGSWL
jgi:hypothetical protein